MNVNSTIRRTPQRVVTPLQIAAAIALSAGPYFMAMVLPQWNFPETPYSDYATYQLPVRRYVQQELRRFVFPHRNPHLLCGQPLHASQQAGICDPLMTPWLFVMPVEDAIRTGLACQLLLAVAGQLALCRFAGVYGWGAVLSCVILCHSGYFVLHFLEGHIGLWGATCRVPWAFFCCLEMFRDPRIHRAPLAALAVSLVYLAGHPQVTYYLVLALVIAALWTINRQRFSRCRVTRFCSVLALSGLLCGLISSCQLLPSVLALMDSSPGEGRGDAAFLRELSLRPIDWVSVCFPFVSPLPSLGEHERGTLVFGHERSLFIGLFAASLCLFRLVQFRLRKGGCLVCIAALSFLVMSDLGGTWGCILARWLPGVSQFRCHGRLWGVLLPWIGILGGSSLGRRPDQTNHWDRSCPTLPSIAACCACLELVSFATLAILVLPLAHFQQTPQQHFPLAGRFLDWPSSGELREHDLAYSKLVHQAHAPDCSMPGTNSGDPRSRFVTEIHRALIDNPIRAAQVLGCEYLITGDAHRVVRIAGALSLIRFHAEHTRQEIQTGIRELDNDDLVNLRCRPSSLDQFNVAADTQQLVITYESDEPGWVVLGEAYSDAWQIQLDGQATSSQIAHKCLMGISVPAGKHELTMTYIAPGFRLGMALSGLGVLVGFAITLLARRSIPS